MIRKTGEAEENDGVEGINGRLREEIEEFFWIREGSQIATTVVVLGGCCYPFRRMLYATDRKETSHTHS